MPPLKDQMKMKTVYDGGGQWWVVAIVPVGLLVLSFGVAILLKWVSNG